MDGRTIYVFHDDHDFDEDQAECFGCFTFDTYYGLLVNEDIGLILVIQTFYPFYLSVLYGKDVYPISFIV